jgi:pimeloyl-ACP methyl ester carboxylesterase
VVFCLLAAPPTTGQARDRKDYVVLIHGLRRSALSMKGLEWVLRREGYRVINVSYPSTRITVSQAADTYLSSLLRDQVPDPEARVHFVTHSMGGIILRQYLAEHRIENLGRVVMIAPPNRGSEIVDKLRRLPLFKWLQGPGANQLATGTESAPNRLGPVGFELGVVAGDRSWNPLFSKWIPGPDDGKVSVESTKVEGMRDFIVVHGSHTWLMWRTDVIGRALTFLQTGSFEPEV